MDDLRLVYCRLFAGDFILLGQDFFPLVQNRPLHFVTAGIAGYPLYAAVDFLITAVQALTEELFTILQTLYGIVVFALIHFITSLTGL